MNEPRYDGPIAIEGPSAEARARFIMRTYGHLIGAIAGFIVIVVTFFNTGVADTLFNALLNSNWLFWLGGYMVVSWIASRVAHNARSLGVQYLALAGFVAAWAVLFTPLLYFANMKAPGIISSAVLVTALGFTGLSGIVYMTRKDFSFLRGILMFGAVMSLVLIVAGSVFGFNLGMAFTVGMIALAGGAILYDTSNILHHYPDDRYVGASLQLFASVALLFWYILQLYLSRD